MHLDNIIDSFSPYTIRGSEAKKLKAEIPTTNLALVIVDSIVERVLSANRTFKSLKEFRNLASQSDNK